MLLPFRPAIFQRPKLASCSGDLSELPPLFEGSHAVKRVYLLASAQSGPALAEKYSIDCDKHGASFLLGSGTPLDKFQARELPYFARREIRPFWSDLAPFTTWGGTLEHLTLGSWLKPIKELALQHYGNKCFFCGTPRWNDSVNELSLRPWLTFSPPKSPPNIGLMKLDGLTVSCRDCSTMFRLGLCRVERRLPQALARIKALMRLSEREVEEYGRFVDGRAITFLEVGWGMDLSRLSQIAPGGITASSPLAVSGSWSDLYDSDDDIHWLQKTTRIRGEEKAAMTCLFGVHYRIHGTKDVVFQSPSDASRATLCFA